MKKGLMVLLCCFAGGVFAQTAQQEINAQVWKPFIRAFNNNDTQGFMAVHSKDIVRSPRDAKIVWNWQAYYQQQEQGDKRAKETGTKRQLELRFTERITNKDLAIEVGIFKTTAKQRDGTAQSFYGRFHVVLRKEGGIWKILVDTDSSEGGMVAERNFIEAMPME